MEKSDDEYDDSFMDEFGDSGDRDSDDYSFDDDEYGEDEEGGGRGYDDRYESLDDYIDKL